MYKKLFPFIPACISFGPLFMTQMGGTAGGNAGEGLVWTGVALLTVGLIAMFRIIVEQEKKIESLQGARRVDA